MSRKSYGTAFFVAAALAALAATLLGYSAGLESSTSWDLLVPAFLISAMAGVYTYVGLRLRRDPPAEIRPEIELDRKVCKTFREGI